MDDRLEEMLRDVGPESFKRAHMYETMCNDLEKSLYPNCTKFTRLSVILRLFNLKARNGWKMLPEGNTLPNHNYEAKKVLCPMSLEYKKIHACPNDCMLYHGEFEGLHQCPRCGLSRYKKKQDDSDYDVSTNLIIRIWICSMDNIYVCICSMQCSLATSDYFSYG
uniref:Uncharacterized protein n=1 Tax=Cajanus cajan TaxID=3821 RepID=A0A151SZK5_CAJCA|nr:hypothetical protein KK1_015688 [Cajanus cajan]